MGASIQVRAATALQRTARVQARAELYPHEDNGREKKRHSAGALEIDR